MAHGGDSPARFNSRRPWLLPSVCLVQLARLVLLAFFWLCFLVSSFRLRSPLACSLAFLESWTSWPLSVFRLLFRHRPPPHLRVRSLSPFYWKGLVIPHPTSRPLSSLCPSDLFISTFVQATATPTLPPVCHIFRTGLGSYLEPLSSFRSPSLSTLLHYHLPLHLF